MRFVTICVGVGAYELERAPKRRDTKGVRYLPAAHAPARHGRSDVQLGVTNLDVCAKFAQKISA
jgi:hypothetical protein